LNFDLIEATEEQAGEINDLVNLAYRGENGWTRETNIVSGDRSTVEEVLGYLADPNTYLFIAKHEERIVTCICVEKTEGVAYIGYFAVHPSYQNMGLGKSVLSKAENFAKESLKVDTYVMVVVSQRPELISYYERRGYVKTGKVLEYPLHLNVGIPIDNNLTIEYLEKNA